MRVWVAVSDPNTHALLKPCRSAGQVAAHHKGTANPAPDTLRRGSSLFWPFGGLGSVITTAVRERPIAAVAVAASRARRVVTKRLKRRLTNKRRQEQTDPHHL